MLSDGLHCSFYRMDRNIVEIVEIVVSENLLMNNYALLPLFERLKLDQEKCICFAMKCQGSFMIDAHDDENLLKMIEESAY